MAKQLQLFLKDQSAATAIEYCLIAAGIALGIIPIVAGAGTHLKSIFSSVSTAVK
jgi:pilus assembly protein Flp/PilA